MIFILKTLLRILPILYMYFIWFQSSHFRPQVIGDSQIGQASMGSLLEYAHLIEFAILYILVILALLTYGYLTRRKEAFSIVVSILYGVIDEIHQYYVPYRSASASDLLKNVIGISIAWYSIHYFYFKANKSPIGTILKGLTAITSKPSNIN